VSKFWNRGITDVTDDLVLGSTRPKSCPVPPFEASDDTWRAHGNPEFIVLSCRSALIPNSFDAFRDWALSAATRASRRWEDPYADELPLLYGQDAYGDLHEIAVPPVYLRRRGGHIGWMTQLLPVEVANRSLCRVCLRISAWTGDSDRYLDLSVDPNRSELLLNVVAEQGRSEVWAAPIGRDKSGLPTLGAWEKYEADEIDGRLLLLVDDALRPGPSRKRRTMPAANMVLGPYDVPRDYFPDFRGDACGPIDWIPEDRVVSTYKAIFRTEEPHHVILSFCYVFTGDYGLDDHIRGALGALERSGNKEIAGPRIGDRSHFFDGLMDGGRLHKYQALWTHGKILCELGLAGPPGIFKARQLSTLAAVQRSRVEEELRAPLTSAE